jgi:phosphatidate phosphatase APP1
MARPHVAAICEDALFRRIDRLLRGRGWQTRTISHTGYGTAEWVRVMGRVLLSRPESGSGRPGAGPGDRHGEPPASDAGASAAQLEEAESLQRGWRAFVTAPAVHVPVRICAGDREVTVHTDRGGYVDVTLDGHHLAPGWHDVVLDAEGAQAVPARVHVIGADVDFGLVSDIDDTVLVTTLPRPLIAGWNTFVRHEAARHVVPGMAQMYAALLGAHPGAPIFYLSTGAWNTAPTMTRFLRRWGYPAGPLLLTDWGPTNTGWFRSGREHKREALRRLARELPQLRWVLVGDDGQHDPLVYGEFARERPDLVDAIAIRQLTATEQVLSHGLPVPNEELKPRGGWSQRATRRPGEGVPVYRAPDGHGLLPLLTAAGFAQPEPVPEAGTAAESEQTGPS